MELRHGRPEACEGRLAKEVRVYDFLDRLAVPYDRVDHEVAMTMEDCLVVDRVLGAPTCKNLFLCNRQQTVFYLLLMPADKPFKTKELSAQINSSRLSFGTAEPMEQFLDITPGSLSVLGLMNDTAHRVTLLIDEDVVKTEFIGCHPCINTATLRLTVRDLVERVIPATGHEPVYVKLIGQE